MEPRREAAALSPSLVAAIGRLVNIAFAAGGTLAFGVVLWSAYASWSGQRRFATWSTVSLYFLAPALAILVCLGARTLKPLSRIRLLLVVVSVVMSVYITEAMLDARNWFPGFGRDAQAQAQSVMTTLAAATDKPRSAAELTAAFGNPIDVRTAGEVLTDLRAAGVDAVPIVTPSNHLFVKRPDGSVLSAVSIEGREVMPLASISGRQTLLCNESGQWVRFQSDRHGFNNPDEAWELRRLDVAALGDSFAQGYCVSKDRSFVDLIRTHRPATLNLGVAGNGPLLMLATLTEYLPRLAPKTVFWFYFEGNDLTNLQDERRSSLLSSYLTDGFLQSDLSRQRDIDAAILALVPKFAATAEENIKRVRQRAVMFHVRAFAKLTSLRDRFGLIEGTEPHSIETATDFDTTNMEVFRDVLRQAKNRVESWNGELQFVYLPSFERYTTLRSAGELKRDEVVALARRLGIPVVDLDPVFIASRDPLSMFPFRAVGHYTERGHQLVAQEVLRRLDLPRGAAQSLVP